MDSKIDSAILGASFAVLLGCLVFTACRPCPDPVNCPSCPDQAKPCPGADAGPPPPPDAGPKPATCAGVCQHLKDLGCPAAKPTPEGHTCEEVCGNVQGSGVVSWDLACRAKAPTCSAVDVCK